MPLNAGDLVAERYEVVELVDDTPTGALYIVRDGESGELRGLTLIPAEAARNAKQLENFRRQVRVARSLEHPGVLRVLDDGEDEGLPFLVTEHIEGRSLREMVAEDGPMESDEVLRLARQLLDALAFLHARDILHRDIRAETLLVASDGRLRLRDFGMAREVEGQKTVALPSGAPGHMSPEHLMGQPLDGRADLYSTGAVLYELLTGEAALEGLDVVSRFTKPPPRVSGVKPEVDPELDQFITSCLDPEPTKRPASSKEALTTITRLLPDAPPPDAEPPEAPEPPVGEDTPPSPESELAPEQEPRLDPQPEPSSPPLPEREETESAAPPEPEPEKAPQPEPEPARELKPEPQSTPDPAPKPSPGFTEADIPAALRKSHGVRLRDLISDQPGQAAKVLDRLIRIIAELDRLAESGNYHAPLTPDTVRFVGDRIVVLDPATRPEPGQTLTVSNPAYLAPECLFQPPYEDDAVALADVYALGHIAFEWLVGRSTYLSRFPAGISDSKLKWMQWHGDPGQNLPRPADAASWIAAPLSDLLEAMAAKNAADRPQSYQELTERLETIRKRVEDTRHVDAAAVEQALEMPSDDPLALLKSPIAIAAGAVVLALLLWLLFA